MINADTMGSIAGLSHGFFTRQGGVSEGLYASLNCGYGSGDDGGKVADNRHRALAFLGRSGDDLVTLYQVHSADALVIEAAGGWAAVVFIGVSSGVGYYLWLWALRHTTPTKVTVFMALGPITATILGALLLDEVITAWFVGGLVCVAGGLWLAHHEPGGRGEGEA